jgi:NitT/TauT family transport system substrate-binding protein
MHTKVVRFAVILFLLFGSVSSALSDVKLKHAGFRTLYLMPLFLAIDRGIFKSHGLEVSYQELDSGALTPAVLLSGGADIVNDDMLGVAPLAEQGKDLLMIYNLLNRMTMDMIVRNDVLTRIGYDAALPPRDRGKFLKGLTIGITRPGAPTDIYARYLMAAGGLDPQRDANFVQIGGVPALRAAFRSGKIDAFMLSPPLPQQLQSDGVGSIIIRGTAGDLPALTDMSFITVFTTRSFADANGATLRAYVRSLQDSMNWIRANHDEALQQLQQNWFKDTPLETLRISYDALLPAMSTTGTFTQAGLEKFVHVYRTVGEHIDLDLGEGKFWTNAYTRD